MKIKLKSYKLLFQLLDILSNSKWLNKLVVNKKVYLGAAIISTSLANSGCSSDKEKGNKLDTSDKSSISERKPINNSKNEVSDSSTINQSSNSILKSKNKSNTIVTVTCYIKIEDDIEVTTCYDIVQPTPEIYKIEDKITEAPENIISANGVYISAEKMPEFKGGYDSLQKFITTNLKYPKSAIQKGDSRVVYVKFIVEKDGKITNASVVKSQYPKLDAEALRLVKIMPEWISGSINSEPVRVWYFLPIKFKVD